MSKQTELNEMPVVTKEKFIKGLKFPLMNMDVEWCHLIKPDTGFSKSQWQLTVRLPEALAIEMRGCGFNVKHSDGKRKFKKGDEEYYFIVAYRKTKTNAGVELSPPKLFDRDGKTPFTQLIGNGSVLNVKISAKYLDVSGEMKLPCRLVSVQIVNHVPYGDDGFDPLPDDNEGASFNDGDDTNSF